MSSKNQNPDPGGSQNPPNRELLDLKDQNEQQLVLIAQLKEMLRKSDQQSNVTDDKVQDYIKTLNRKKKTKTTKDEGSIETTSVNVSLNKNERLNLLRQQMEENKAKLAERGKSQKGLEEMVTQLTVQFNDSQHLISQSPLNISLQETKLLDYTINTPPEELYNILLSKEKKITELSSKLLKLEGNVLDLQENVKEKDSVIDARTKAITLMTESLNKKGKNTLDELDDTKEQMQKMQQNFITLEQEMKNRQLKLLDDLKLKNTEILDLQELNSKLEKEKEDLRNELEENIKMLVEYKQQEVAQKEETLESSKQSPSKGSKKRKGKQNQKIKGETVSDDANKLDTDFNKLTSELTELKKINEDLVTKNKELVDENNNIISKHNSLSEENKKLLVKVNQLQSEASNTLEELNQMKDKMRENITTEKTTDDNDELAKLKKQLEESNKSMIKIKAQHKGKVKELNKKLDTFKKMSDSNALILQLQNDITKMEQKIAELEDEKGNLQLKMVESTESVKDEFSDERLKEKEELVNTLETDNKNLQDQLTELNEKLSLLSQAQNDQVTSEMSNIQIEEKLDLVENQKKLVEEEKEQLIKDNADLEERINSIIKEKIELNSKLESYIQENMELIDKLEKLSAEKVSSAESIEIVEGLTQQEKLELAAYQQNLEIPADLKWAKDDNLEHSDIAMDQAEPPEELNESVLQLNEDSTELLQKIEMFNIERKEVMLKLDALRDENLKLIEDLKEFDKLKNENNQLALKLKEVENNRDVLEETYEQLQTEKDVLEREKDILENKIKGLEQGVSQNLTSGDNLDVKLIELQEKCDQLLEENNQLKKSLKELNESVSEKESNLIASLHKAETDNKNLEVTIKDHLQEIENYKDIIEESKQELINSSQQITNMQQGISEKEQKIIADKEEVETLKNKIIDLSNALNNLEQLQSNKNDEIDVKVNENLHILEGELNELKSTLNVQIEQAQEYEKELSEKHEIMMQLNEQLKELNIRLAQTEEKLQIKENEVLKLTEDISEQEEFIKSLENTVSAKNNELSIKDKQIGNLQQTINEKDIKFKDLTTELTDKFMKLQKQFDGNNGSLEKKIIELQTKNKELVDKLKKIAANLKKKTQECKELQEAYKNDKEKWETEDNSEKDLIVNNLKSEVEQKDSLISQIQTKIEELTVEKSELEENNVQLQNTILKLKEDGSKEKENDLSLKQEFFNVQEQTDTAESIVEVKDTKIKELEMIIETQENDLSDYKAKISRLEEGLAILEERRQSLERSNVELGDKLTETSASFEEKSLEEEQLEHRMASLLQQDELLTKKIETVILENEELGLKNQDLLEEQGKLNEIINNYQDKLHEMSAVQNSNQELEQSNGDHLKQITNLENQLKIVQQENCELIEKNKSEFEKYENEIQIQLDDILSSKNDIVIKNEKQEEQIQELIEKNNELLNMVEEQQAKLEKQSQDNETFSERENLVLEIQKEVQVLKERESELVKEIDLLKNELLNVTATEVVDSIIVEAKSQIASKEPSPEHNIGTENTSCIPTFTWSENNTKQEASSDWFSTINNAKSNDLTNVQSEDTIQKQEVSQSLAENVLPDNSNSRDELLQKIKTLEFMLYSVEKEKDNALLQCHELSNELTRLVYEREHAKGPKKSAPVENIAPASIEGLESQILSMSEVDSYDNKSLQNLEYEQSRPVLEVAQSGPEVIEESFSKKEAYKCFKDGEDGGILEDVKGGQATNLLLEGFVDDNDDGWGWGPEEAKKEEAFMLKSASPEVNNLKAQVESLTEQLRVYQLEREQHMEEIKQLQVKSGKLIKKCKEFKLKYDQLSQGKKGIQNVSKPDDFFNLDNAIQEELKSQVQSLEKSLKEIQMELEKEKLEKANMLKKVDTLTTANEKLVELKERQEIEMVNIERKYHETTQKLESYEWENDSFNDVKETKNVDKNETPTEDFAKKYEESKKQVEEIKDSLKDIMLDNEELQSLLEEQRNLRVTAENKLKSISVIQENVKSEEDYNMLVDQKTTLENELKALRENTVSLDEFHNLQKSIEDMSDNQNKLRTEEEYSVILNLKNDLERQLQLLQENSKTIDEYNLLLNDRNNLQQQINNLSANQATNDNEWVRKFEEECESKNYLQMRFMHIETNYENITRELSELRLQAEREKELLQQEIVAKNSNCSELSNENEKLKEQLKSLESVLIERDVKISELTEQLDVMQKEIKKFDQEHNEMCAKNIELQETMEKYMSQKNDIVKELDKVNETNVEFGDHNTSNMAKVEVQRAELQDFKNRMESFLEGKSSHVDNVGYEELQNLKDEFRRTLNYYETLHSMKEKYQSQAANSSTVPLGNPASFFDSIQNPVDNFEQEVLGLQNEVLHLSANVQKLDEENKSLNEKVKATDANNQDSNDIADLNLQIQRMKEENARLLDSLQTNQQLIQQIQTDYQKNMELTVEDLNKKWEEEVISRGDVIADTWKQHLESVEAEFGQIKEELQREINEYEEKCNALVNENNELRKNVDAEIRNEVDKLSALQQQITNGQKTISELSQTLQQRETELQQTQNNLIMLQSQLDNQKVELFEKGNKLENINVVIETTMKQFDEKREVVEEIVRLLERNTNSPLSFEKESIISEAEKQITAGVNNQNEASSLKKYIIDLEESLSTVQLQLDSKTAELDNTLKVLEDSNQKIDAYITQQLALEHSLDEKNREISSLSGKLEQLELLKNDNNKDVHNLQIELEESKNNYALLQASLAETSSQLSVATTYFEEKCKAFDQLNVEIQNLQQQYNSKENEYANLHLHYEEKCREINSIVEKQNIDNNASTQNEETYKSKIRDLENYYENALLEKQNDYESIKLLNASLQTDLETLKTNVTKGEKDAIESLKGQIDALTQQNQEYQNYYQDYSLKMQELSQQLSERSQYSQNLEIRIAELEHTVEALNAQIRKQNEAFADQTEVITENNKQLNDMKQIIENQVAKIEELKKDLFEKSKEFDSLIAEVDISSVKNTGAITRQPAATTDEVPKSHQSDELSDAVSRAELDLALYMLHQRDVRCEELTVELTQLLEERDTLQLRLSNAIREKEELRKKKVCFEEPSTSESSTNLTNSPSKSGAIFMAASGIELGTEPIEDTPINLESKLSQLKSVGYKKDKTFVDEQELRRIQQLAIMQEHINEASKLPPEAAQKLVDASYTLSRDVQSPSKVLLNWLWGRSTPKVNDT